MTALAAIHAAFDGVPSPAPPSRTLRQAEAWDHYDVVDRSKDHEGRWQDLPAAHIRACQNALPHLDAQGIRYYLPALMCHYLEHTVEQSQWGFDSLLFTLGPASEGLGQYRKQRMALLTDEQCRAIALFLSEVEAEEEIVALWRKWLPEPG